MKLKKITYCKTSYTVLIFFIDNKRMWQGKFNDEGIVGYRKNNRMVGKCLYKYINTKYHL